MPEKAIKSDGVIKLAVLAVGGQGGGVITDWIVDLAERNGWYAQSTSVPGVAQRTGATIYYVEMVPEGDGTPILGLMPAPGDVDIVLTAELMEAGRAIQRGFVTPDRTTLITSTDRTLAVLEKVVPGSGIGDPGPVIEAARV
jgi:indolepyruvate ferredoxin oxidoreductase beta subunit